MISRPIVIELTEVKETPVFIEEILKPKVAKAKRLSERQMKIISVYKKFQEKYTF